MGADYKDTLAELITASNCFQTCKMEKQRLALDIYIRCKELAGIGGQPDYTAPGGVSQMKQDAKNLDSQIWDAAVRQSVGVYLDLQNAITVNAGFTATDLNSLSAGASCFDCLSEEVLKNALVYLKWKLNKLSEPE